MTVSFLACGTSSCTFLHFLLGWRVSGHVRTCGLRTRIHPSFFLVCSCLHTPSFILVHKSTSTGLSSSAKRSKSPKPTCLCLIQTDPMQPTRFSFPPFHIPFSRICGYVRLRIPPLSLLHLLPPQVWLSLLFPSLFPSILGAFFLF